MFPYIFYLVVCIPRFFEKKPIESPKKNSIAWKKYIYIKFHFIDIKEYKGGHDSRVEIVDKKTATKKDKNY